MSSLCNFTYSSKISGKSVHKQEKFFLRLFMQICVLFEILHLYMILWDFALVKTRDLWRNSNQGIWGAVALSVIKKIITDFIYFKTVSITISDVYWIARLSWFYTKRRSPLLRGNQKKTQHRHPRMEALLETLCEFIEL